MRPENLKSPYKWEARKPLLQDRIFFVPEYYSNYAEFSLPPWQDEAVFANDRPVKVEYCSGNGSWIAACALQDRLSNWVAVEMRFDRVRKIWSKIKNHQLDNLLAVAGEGLKVTQYYFKSASVDEIFINFPDPWPKKRHAKHRIVQPQFIEQMRRILKVEGKVTIVTDDPDYSNEIIQLMNSFNGFKSQFVEPHYVHEFPNYGTSYFEELWRSKGKAIRYHQYTKMA